MKKWSFLFILVMIILSSCEEQKELSSINPENWSKRAIDISALDSLEYGKSYLSVYSQIYNRTEHVKSNLTTTVSMRNKSETDTIYLLRAEYFDTEGTSLRNYFNQTIYLAPLETTEIIIEELDISGGTGSNFIIEWKTPPNCPEPLFEGIMTSTMGQQGISFTTKAERID